MAAYRDRTAQRNQRVKRIHIRCGGNYTLCNRPKSTDDIVTALYGYVGDAPSNLCKLCQRAHLK